MYIFKKEPEVLTNLWNKLSSSPNSFATVIERLQDVSSQMTEHHHLKLTIVDKGNQKILTKASLVIKFMSVYIEFRHATM